MKKCVADVLRVDFVVSAGVGGSLVERHLEDLRQVRDACMGEDSPKERLRLRLRELGLPLNGRRSDDISLRKLSQAMGINLQHEDGNRKDRDELVEALVSALLSEVPVLANFHASYVEASLKDLRQIRDGLSGQAEQRGELRERLSKLAIKDKDKRDHVVTLTDLSKSLELPVGNRGGGLSKTAHVEQILTALLAEVPATANVDDATVDDAKTALVDASFRELLALRDGLAGQASQRQELERRLDQFNVRNRSSDVVTLQDLSRSLGMATKQQGRYMSGGVLKRQIVEFLLRGSLDAAKKASVDATLQELRRVRDGVEEQAARRGKLAGCLKNVRFQHQNPDVVVLQDLCCALELPIANERGGLKRPEMVEQIVVSLLAEVKAALVDKTLQELRRVRDGVEEQAARRGKLEACLKNVKFQHQGPDVLVLQDLCCALELPIAKSYGGGLKRPKWWSRSYRLWWQKVLCLVVMLTNLVSAWQWSCVGWWMGRSGMWMQLCGKFATPSNAAFVWAQFWWELRKRICWGDIKVLNIGLSDLSTFYLDFCNMHGCSVIRCHRMSLTISGFSQQISWEIDRKMTACVVVQNVWLLHWQWSSAKKRDASSGVSCLAPKTLWSLGRVFVWFWNI